MIVKTLNENQFKEECGILFSSVIEPVDLVVGILNGGKNVVDAYKHFDEDFKTQYSFVKVKKRKITNWLKLSKVPFGFLPYKTLDFLRNLELRIKHVKLKKASKRGMTWSSKKIEYDFSHLEIEKIQTILIVDDALDSGRTMYNVKSILKKKIPKAEIKTAVISWTLHNSVLKPDYYRFKDVLVRFFWSFDYKK